MSDVILIQRGRQRRRTKQMDKGGRGFLLLMCVDITYQQRCEWVIEIVNDKLMTVSL